MGVVGPGQSWVVSSLGKWGVSKKQLSVELRASQGAQARERKPGSRLLLGLLPLLLFRACHDDEL